MKIALKFLLRSTLQIISRFSSSILTLLELEITRVQGKGFASYSQSQEVSSVGKFIDSMNLMNLCLFDVGANLGEYSLNFIKKYPNSEVHLFEPQTGCFEYLKSLFRSDSNIHLHKYGISRKSGLGNLFYSSSNNQVSSLLDRDLTFSDLIFDGKETVNLISLDEFIERTGILPIVLKLDIEGSELDALMGTTTNLSRIPIIQFEFGGANKDSRTFFIDFWKFFEKFDFSIFRITPLGTSRIYKYSELDEYFLSTNYLAINNRFHKPE